MLRVRVRVRVRAVMQAHAVKMLSSFGARSPMLLLPATHAPAFPVHGMQAPLVGEQA